MENSELLHVAREKLLTTEADFILANDLKNIEGQKHKALLVSKNEVTALDTKSEIADSLLKISEELKMTKITLAVTGSIAAYKAADLTSLLTKRGT